MTAEVGSWIGQQILEKGNAPGEKEVVVKIISETLEFFAGYEDQVELNQKLEAAVMQTVEAWIQKKKQ